MTISYPQSLKKVPLVRESVLDWTATSSMLQPRNSIAWKWPVVVVTLAESRRGTLHHDDKALLNAPDLNGMLRRIVLCSNLPPDGGVGGHAPAKSQGVTSNNFTLTGYSCMPSSTSPDCSAFPGGVQEIFSFYNQSGTPFNSISINLQFDSSNAGDYVGCTIGQYRANVDTIQLSGRECLIPSSGGRHAHLPTGPRRGRSWLLRRQHYRV